MEMADRGDGVRLAFEPLPGRSPTVVFLPGFRSSMAGEKAVALAAWCARTGQAMLRLDYSGHGRSQGRFADGTIGRWTADAAFLLDRVQGPVVLVGSSMGGWIALLLALARPGRVAALVGVAAAPDFTEALMWEAMLPQEREALRRRGTLEVPGGHGAFPLTWRLIEEGRDHLLLDGAVALRCPVRLLHGQADAAGLGRRPGHAGQGRHAPVLAPAGPGAAGRGRGESRCGRARMFHVKHRCASK